MYRKNILKVAYYISVQSEILAMRIRITLTQK